jgi:hypothetical protein
VKLRNPFIYRERNPGWPTWSGGRRALESLSNFFNVSQRPIAPIDGTQHRQRPRVIQIVMQPANPRHVAATDRVGVHPKHPCCLDIQTSLSTAAANRPEEATLAPMTAP